MENQITIFLNNGHVLLFQNVKNVDVTNEYIAFDYFGISANQDKTGIFYTSKIVGWSASKGLLEA